MMTCPCCSHQLLRHIRQNQIHWFCRYCWQIMPSLSQDVPVMSQTLQIVHTRSLVTVMTQQNTQSISCLKAVERVLHN